MGKLKRIVPVVQVMAVVFAFGWVRATKGGSQMFEVPAKFVTIGYLLYAIVGSVVGVFSGVLTSTVFKLRLQGIPIDAFLGAVGFVTALLVAIVGQFPHQRYFAAFATAAILPALRQVTRLKAAGPK